MSPIVERLIALIEHHDWRARFDLALWHAAQHNVAAVAHLRTLDDYLVFIDEMVRWAPRESGDSRLVHDKLVAFYFILDQPPLLELQSPVRATPTAPMLSPLSAWIVAYAQSWGEYLDTPESAAHIDSFRGNPAFHWNDYMPPPSGYRTFNQFFARHVKPGYRPIEQPAAANVIVAPADAVHLGVWPISTESTVELKGMRWGIAQLLEDSAFADRFAGGVFTHCALRTFDYHRWHAPLAGTVLETKIISGQACLEVQVVQNEAGQPTLHAVEGAGYQFVQTRGLAILNTSVGLVACLPVGMAQVSSVVITAEVGKAIRKGDELGYFQFGGSDFVMLFEARCNASFTCAVDQHHLQGVATGICTAH